MEKNGRKNLIGPNSSNLGSRGEKTKTTLVMRLKNQPLYRVIMRSMFKFSQDSDVYKYTNL